ncbi:anti-CBASS protein Acb1 family protein [Natrarchaeobaculum sulfurireducens]|uniref:Anti-CBASS protein Acb1-like N-terminal domain-containing protein n=1 Tax=Natrarchaeobaculum sulfurireducens TaxID=2044521 RepID=A0A346PHK1_9EURY|nr:anti-CBASS Acb1 family protein [Natrarchaeobaculum sulfurireducens]AXR78996.1 hypothetical protein AArc1_2683 [Natrarchaeobaculum sulfurireducens]
MTDEDTETEAELVTRDGGLSTRQEFQMRFALAQALGENLPGDEDYYEVFNWDKNPTVEDYFALALRNPYAYAVTFLPPETTWRDPPEIDDHAEPSGSADQTSFEADVEDLVDDLRLWHYCRRADKLAGIGKFGALVLEFDDTEDPSDLDTPVEQGSELTGLRPFSRASVADVRVGGPGSGRWNEPIRYQLDFSDENENEGVIRQEGPETVWVHWSRVIHIPSDELLDDELRGIPRQKPVYNNLIDIERTLGSAGQLAYRAAAWGIHINISENFDVDDGGDELREHLQRWQHGLENVLRTHGADDVKSLGGEEIEPSPIIDPNIEAISSQTGIPQSVLKGNETGERATTQDLKEWYGKISERRNEFVEPLIVRELIDRLVDFGSIEPPAGDGYDTIWKPLAELSEADQADVRETRADVLETWMQVAPGILTPEQQLEYIEDGKLPAELDTAELPPLDEDNDEVEAQWQSLQAGD